MIPAILRESWPARLVALALLFTLLDIAAVLLEVAGMLADRPAVSVGMRSASAICAALSFVARVWAQHNERPRD